jgi:hypothetical protein
MIRTVLTTGALAATLLSAPGVFALSANASVTWQAPGQVTAAEAAAFIGDWTLALQGPDGPGTFELSLVVEKEKVIGEISSEQLAKQPISMITRTDKGLTLGYSFTWEGNPVDAVVSLTPAVDGKVKAEIDFAGGAYIMSGTATKKDKPKQ